MNTFPTGPSSAPPAPRRDEPAARPDNAGDRQRVRDFERLPETSAAMVKLRSIHRMVRRARPPRWRKKFRYKRPPKAAA